jgi:hypothetical protein
MTHRGARCMPLGGAEEGHDAAWGALGRSVRVPAREELLCAMMSIPRRSCAYANQDMSLRQAMSRWKALPREQQILADFFRDTDKEPPIFGLAEIEKLAKCKLFGTVSTDGD